MNDNGRSLNTSVDIEGVDLASDAADADVIVIPLSRRIEIDGVVEDVEEDGEVDNGSENDGNLKVL